jgi:hypothetical protein
MSKSSLFGEILGRPCTMEVIADTVEEAEKKLAAEEFSIFDVDADSRNASFQWDGVDSEVDEEKDAEGVGA